MTEGNTESSKLLRRYNHLITAFRRAAHNQGWELTLVRVPETADYPFVLICSPTQDAGERMADAKELLFLFASRDTFVQSNVIADICRHMRIYQDEVTAIYMLFDQAAKANVENVMRVSGLANHLRVHYFRRVDGEALFDWSPGRIVTEAGTPQYLQNISLPLLGDHV